MNTKLSTKSITHPECKLYKKRWLMLGIFMLYAINNGFHWIQFSIINDIIKRYYGVSATQVEWTTNIFFLTYILLITPSLYMMGKVVGTGYKYLYDTIYKTIIEIGTHT